MSSFSMFDAKGGEFRGPKASINLVSTNGNGQERDDSGLWISLSNGEN